jgi:hypothetical protein
MAKNFEKRILQKCLRINFYTYIPMNPYKFLKKHYNRCTLVQGHDFLSDGSCYAVGVDPQLFSLDPDPDPTFQVVLDPIQDILSERYSYELCRIHPL